LAPLLIHAGGLADGLVSAQEQNGFAHAPFSRQPFRESLRCYHSPSAIHKRRNRVHDDATIRKTCPAALQGLNDSRTLVQTLGSFRDRS
jgi:hypothetical protein